jgi:hypothetical protein
MGAWLSTQWAPCTHTAHPACHLRAPPHHRLPVLRMRAWPCLSSPKCPPRLQGSPMAAGNLLERRPVPLACRRQARRRAPAKGRPGAAAPRRRVGGGRQGRDGEGSCRGGCGARRCGMSKGSLCGFSQAYGAVPPGTVCWLPWHVNDYPTLPCSCHVWPSLRRPASCTADCGVTHDCASFSLPR